MLGNRNLIAPYLEWAVATNFAYLGGEWFRVLLEVEGSAASFASDVEKFAIKPLIRVPTIYQTPPRDLKPTDVTFCMAIMSREALSILVTGEEPGGAKLERELVANLVSLAGRIKNIELGTSHKMPFDKSTPRELKPISADKPKVAIVAVIDDGLAFAHERFRSGTGHTRFKYFWNQDDTTIAHSPSGFGWGRELTQNNINDLLASCSYSNIVDEDEVYRQAGQTLAARRVKHGTHVMDLACGLGPRDVEANSPYLIGVQLPKWVTEETSGALLTPVVYDAITYILSRADQIATDEGTAPLPIVINLSYGNIAGPHDGTAPLERAIDQLIAARQTPLRVVLPAGNHYLARCHSRFSLAAATSPDGSIDVLRWRIQPDDKSASFVEIWLPEAAAGQTRPQVAVRVTTPIGETTPWIQPGSQWPPPTNHNVRFLVVNLDLAGERPRIVLAVAPTAETTTSLRTAPSGTWLVEVKNEGSAVSVDAWVQRGDTPFGYPLWGRQSRFDNSNYRRFDPAGRLQEQDSPSSPIRRRSTINALATEQQAIVIGGFRRSDYHPSRYSGAGPVATPPTVPPPRTGPDAAAVADDSVALHGVLAAGTRSGSVVAMNGTSVAAPQITRLIAEWMTNGLASDRAAVQTFARTRDTKPPPSGPAPNERIGTGRIETPARVKERWTRW
jgi:hypothetical protein